MPGFLFNAYSSAFYWLQFKLKPWIIFQLQSPTEVSIGICLVSYMPLLRSS